jgi:hypothetical protein
MWNIKESFLNKKLSSVIFVFVNQKRSTMRISLEKMINIRFGMQPKTKCNELDFYWITWPNIFKLHRTKWNTWFGWDHTFSSILWQYWNFIQYYDKYTRNHTYIYIYINECFFVCPVCAPITFIRLQWNFGELLCEYPRKFLN